MGVPYMFSGPISEASLLFLLRNKSLVSECWSCKQRVRKKNKNEEHEVIKFKPLGKDGEWSQSCSRVEEGENGTNWSYNTERLRHSSVCGGKKLRLDFWNYVRKKKRTPFSNRISKIKLFLSRVRTPRNFSHVHWCHPCSDLIQANVMISHTGVTSLTFQWGDKNHRQLQNAERRASQLVIQYHVVSPEIIYM